MRNPKKAPKVDSRGKSVKQSIHHVSGRIAWRFSTWDKEGPFSMPPPEDQLTEVIEKLHGLDSMQWSELPKKNHHTLSPSSLSKQAKKRLEEIKKSDLVDQLFSFRLSGKVRIICVRVQDVANILWYDPEHKVSISKGANN